MSWRETKLIGQDRLLKKIYLFLKKDTPLLLSGKQGVGKSALLEWCFEHYEGKKAFVSSRQMSHKEILLGVCQGWGIKAVDSEGKKIGVSKANISCLTKGIMREESGAIFIDDISALPPAMIKRVEIWLEHFIVYGTAVSPSKNSLNKIKWFLKEFEIKPIEAKKRPELCAAMIRHIGSELSPIAVAHASNGLPGKMLGMIKGNLPVNSGRNAEIGEIDLSPVALIMVVALVTLRYLGRSLNQDDLYLVSGIGMGFFVFLRFFLYRGMKR